MARPEPVKFVTDASAANSPLKPRPVVAVGGMPAGSVPIATTAVAGTVKKMPTQANSTATDVAGLLADFNALLAKLRTAGILS